MYNYNGNYNNGFMARQSPFQQPVYPQGYPGAFPPYPAAQNGQQMMPPQEPPISEIRFLTADEMKAFIVMPNTRALLIDRQSGIACIKSANAMGQSEIKTYSFKEFDEAQREAPKKDPMPDYESEIKALSARLEKLENGNKKTKGEPPTS